MNYQNSFNPLIANKAVTPVPLIIVKALQVTSVAAVSRAHELDIIVDIVLDFFDIFVQSTVVRVSLPDEPLASSILELFAGLLAGRGGKDSSGVRNNVASPEISVNVDIAHEAFFGKMRSDNFL